VRKVKNSHAVSILTVVYYTWY